ncbi:hypothetical protein EJB05_27747, partial [Eragrostis curvula]
MSRHYGDILFMQRAAWQQPITALDSWDPTLVNPCTWEYVTCDNESHITRLYATISSSYYHDRFAYGFKECWYVRPSDSRELGDLKKLQLMEVFGNGLNGSIPTTLGKLSNLINLDLQDNLLSGTIPASLGAINTLKNMYTAFSAFSHKVAWEQPDRIDTHIFGKSDQPCELGTSEEFAEWTHSCLPRQYQDTTVSVNRNEKIDVEYVGRHRPRQNE